MSLAEQALFLLDIQPSAQSRKSLENFSSLDQTIVESLPGTQSPAEPKAVAEANPFFVASRMSRTHYEDQARAESLTHALRQLRASHAAKSRNSRQP